MWYYANGQEPIGPLDEQAFNDAVATGLVHDATLVWREGMEEWRPWQTLRPAPATYFPAEHVGDLPGPYLYAGFWVRLFAKIIDGVITFVAAFLLQMLAMLLHASMDSGFTLVTAESDDAFVLLSWVLGMGLTLAYHVYFIGRFGATPGKMAVGVKVIRADGQPVTYARALARHVVEYLSAIILYLGYVIAVFDDQKRTLHDRLCDTRVVKA